ncbi:MAG TPA: TrmH family RNA methyltransferase [Acidobacteriaceae bacterium]|nr:TrmH family RNA methyltransferase [Acidobacteriaceae bacterium]
MLTEEEAGNLRVVLVAARNPLNIGAAARAMSNFGFLRLCVVNCYDVAFREARSAVGAPQLLANAREFASVAEAVADCGLVVGTTEGGHRQIEQPLLRLDAGGGVIRARLRADRVALLFGSEKRGLSNNDLSYCHWLMRIPTREVHGSMNLGQAVAVCLYELVRDNAAMVRQDAMQRASGAALERMAQALLSSLKESGYIKPGMDATTKEKARRLVHRMELSEEDAELWTGMLAKSGNRVKGKGRNQ